MPGAFYLHLRTVGNRAGQQTDDALSGSHTRLGALRAAVSKPTALNVHEITATLKLARGVGTQEAEFIEL